MKKKQNSMTPAEVLEKFGMNAFIEVMKRIRPDWTILPNEDGKGYQVVMPDHGVLNVDNVNISYEKFEEYKRCQKLGKFNMLEYSSWQPYTILSKCEWFEILSNYEKYEIKFNRKRA